MPWYHWIKSGHRYGNYLWIEATASATTDEQPRRRVQGGGRRFMSSLGELPHRCVQGGSAAHNRQACLWQVRSCAADAATSCWASSANQRRPFKDTSNDASRTPPTKLQGGLQESMFPSFLFSFSSSCSLFHLTHRPCDNADK